MTGRPSRSKCRLVTSLSESGRPPIHGSEAPPTPRASSGSGHRRSRSVSRRPARVQQEEVSPPSSSARPQRSASRARPFQSPAPRPPENKRSQSRRPPIHPRGAPPMPLHEQRSPSPTSRPPARVNRSMSQNRTNVESLVSPPPSRPQRSASRARPLQSSNAPRVSGRTPRSESRRPPEDSDSPPAPSPRSQRSVSRSRPSSPSILPRSSSTSQAVNDRRSQSAPPSSQRAPQSKSQSSRPLSPVSAPSRRRNGDHSVAKKKKKRKTRGPSRSDTLAFCKTLRGSTPGSKKFVEKFAKYKPYHFQNPNFPLKIHENGEEFEKLKSSKLDAVHIFKTRKGLKLKVPIKLTFESIPEVINPDREVGVNFGCVQKGNRKIRQLVKAFRVKPEKRNGIPMNSLTITCGGEKLSKKFNEPLFVRRNSMIKILLDALEKEEDTEKVRALKNMIEKHQYDKFLFLSMKGCFTDVHIDLSGTSVHNHLYSGKKVFFFAKPTPRNLKIFEEYQKDSSEKKWLGELLADQWQMVELEEGVTMLCPAGYLHFVFTPEDTIMLGGNFLMESASRLQFQITKMEEELYKMHLEAGGHQNDSHLYQGFRPLMAAYAEYVILPKLRSGVRTTQLLSLADTFAKNLEKNEAAPYKQKDVEKIKEDLGKLVVQLKKRQQPRSDEPGTSGPPPAKKAREQ